MQKSIDLNEEKNKKNNLAEEIYENLKNLIIYQDIKMGSHLKEEELAEQFSTSRTPVREALNKMVMNKLVVKKPRKGFSVINLDIDDFINLCEVREVLENLAINKAIKFINPKDKLIMKSIFKSYKEAVNKDNYKESLDLDSQFHLYIAKISNNPWIIETLNKIKIHNKIIMNIHCQNKTDLKLSVCEHQKILNAILKEDTKKAEEELFKHLKRTRDDVLMALHENQNI